MKVGLVTGKHALSLVDMPDPEPSPGKAVVAITYCGICGTDLHAYQSGAPYNPAICGHEWSGHVESFGSGVQDLREGDRVAIGIATACGRCTTCRRGDAAHCEDAFAGVVGAGPLAAPHGGFASHIAIDARRLYQVVPSLADAAAAMLEPATIAVHAVRRTPMRLGDSVVVIGGGPIGLLVVQAARAAGAGRIVLLEPQPSRREIGKRVGADLTIDPSTAKDTLDVAGADVVFECAGIPETIQRSVELVRRGGVVSLVGFPNRPAQIDAAQWLIKEVRLTSSLAYQREEFAITQALVADGRIDTAALHTSTVMLDDLGDAFARLSDAPEEVKVLVDPR